MFDQNAFNNALATKYNILGQQANASLLGAQAANRQATAANINANANAALTSGRQGLLGAQAELAQKQGGVAGAQTNLIGQEAAQVAPNAESQRALQGAQGGFLGAQTQSLQNNDLYPYSTNELGVLHGLVTQPVGNPLGIQGFSQGSANVSYAEGGTRVPGRDKGKDKVSAMLRPGEAVLVPGAAEEVGRDKIAALNAKHNAQDEAKGKLPAGRGMVEHDCMGTARAGYSGGSPMVGYNTGSSNVQECYPNVDPQGMREEPQEFSKGTHNVQPGKSAKTPKIDPGVLQALLSMGSGGAGPSPGVGAPGPVPAPPQGLPAGRGML